MCTGKQHEWTLFSRPPSQIFGHFVLTFYNMPTVSTISRPCLLWADSVYKLQNPPHTCPVSINLSWTECFKEAFRSIVGVGNNGAEGPTPPGSIHVVRGYSYNCACWMPLS